ncbi:MAG: hypothetical protein HKN18_14715 [Silicimonas sp.]|nr:hypothetical protein [Silicimonas sp.]
MVSTRLTQSFVSCDLGDPGRRDRVDPGKLLDLIQRIRGASATQPEMPRKPASTSKPLANAS